MEQHSFLYISKAPQDGSSQCLALKESTTYTTALSLMPSLVVVVELWCDMTPPSLSRIVTPQYWRGKEMYVDTFSTRRGDKDFRFAHKRYRPPASRVLQTGQLREHGSHIGYAGVRRATEFALCITPGCH